ncbi:MAG: cupin domain-containing protein [Rhodospirillaceae bacterium]
MKKHPEGGHYVETYRDVNEGCGRGVCTAIYFLLRAGERSHWHRIDAVEIWHWYAGAPLLLALSVDGCGLRGVTLGNDIFAGQQPQVVVPVGAWQAAESLGAWTLTGCTVAPAFDFAGFEMAPPDWVPGS